MAISYHFPSVLALLTKNVLYHQNFLTVPPNPRRQGQLNDTQTPANPGTQLTGQSHVGWGGASWVPGVLPHMLCLLLSAVLQTDVVIPIVQLQKLRVPRD